jgi:hypothetical protein
MVSSLGYAVKWLHNLEYKALPLGNSWWWSDVEVSIESGRGLGIGLCDVSEVDMELGK